MSSLAGRIAGAGLVVAAVAIVILAALLHQDMSRETSLSREIQALQEVRGGLDSLKDSLYRMRHAILARTPGVERERVAVDAELDYLRAKAAERPDVAQALAASEAPVRDYVDQASLALRAAPSGPGHSPPLDELEERAFRSIQRATGRVTEEITRRTNAQIQSWASRELMVSALVAGAFALLVGLGVAFRQTLRRTRRDAARIEQLAHYDSLTGLANRSLLGDRLDLMIAMSHRNAAPMAILLFDLDGLKGVNDSLGHAAGDALLVSVAQRARSCVRASDTVGRLGGDEFLVLLPDTDREGARSVATKLLESLAQPFDLGPERACVSASIGGSFLPGPSADAAALVRAADEALYASKRGGRNRYTEGESGEVPGSPSPGDA